MAITEGLLAAEPEVQARMVGDGEPPARLGVPLNGHFRWFGPARPAAEVSVHQRGGCEAGGSARGFAGSRLVWLLLLAASFASPPTSALP